ncbi:MAG: hypothetical protein R6T83_00470 [Salinibacter sp.]
MLGLPLDVWAMMLFSIVVFFGTSTWAMVYSIVQEERKMRILRDEGALDTHSPRALQDLSAWLEAHSESGTADAVEARRAYDACVDALRSTDRHFYNWSDEDLRRRLGSS